MTTALYEAFVKFILPVLATGLGGLLVILFAAAGDWCRARAKESKLAAVGAQVAMLADLVVADIEATLRPKLALAAEDGQLTSAEAAELKQVAMDRLKQLLAEKGLASVKGVFGILAPQVELFLSGAIERAVARLPEPSLTATLPVVATVVPSMPSGR
jgi:hypothetical protein